MASSSAASASSTPSTCGTPATRRKSACRRLLGRTDSIQLIRQRPVRAPVEELELELVSHQPDVSKVPSIRIAGPEDDVDLTDSLEVVLEVVQLPPLLGRVVIRAVVHGRI